MNQSRPDSSRSPAYINLCFIVAVAIAAAGAVRYVSYRNMQTQTLREIKKTEDRITAINQDEIPSIDAEISQQLVRYDMREKLRAQASSLVPTPPNRMELINLKEPHKSTP